MSRWGRSQDSTGSKDQRVRLVTGGRFGAGPGLDVEHEPVIFNPPATKDPFGGVCSATGYHGSQSQMVSVDGMMFLREFSPERVNK